MLNIDRIKAGYRGKLIRETFEVDLHLLASQTHIPLEMLRAYENQEDYPPIWAAMSIASFFDISLSFLYGFDKCEVHYKAPSEKTTPMIKDRLPKIILQIRHEMDMSDEFKEKVESLDITEEMLQAYSKEYNILDNPFDIIDLYKFSLLTNKSVDYLLGISNFETPYDFINYEINHKNKYSMNKPPDKLTYMQYYQSKSSRNDDILKYRLMNEIHKKGYTKLTIIDLFNANCDFRISDSAIYNLLYRKNGLLSIRYVIKLAELLDCSLDYLYCFSEKNIPNNCYTYHPRFEELRKSANLSQRQFKQLIHTEAGYNSFANEIPIENLKIRVNTLYNIKKNFDCTIDWLFGFVDENPFIAKNQIETISSKLYQGAIVSITRITTKKQELCICIGRDPDTQCFLFRTGSDEKLTLDESLVNNYEIYVLPSQF